MASMIYLFRELVRVSTVSIHISNRCRGSAVTEEMQELVDSFRITNMEAKNWLIGKLYSQARYHILPEL